MPNTNDSYSPPLYVRVPRESHHYLDTIKEESGISKSDSVTLLLHVASKLIDAKMMQEMFDEYMLEGDVVKTLLRVEQPATME